MIRMSIRLSFVLVLISWSTYQVAAGQNLEKQLEQLRNNYINKQQDLEKQVHQLKAQSLRQVGSTLPRSCWDLKTMGQSVNGIYLVQGAKSIETVFCDFKKHPSDADYQNWIGFVDVKTFPVYFYAQRTSTYANVETIVPFEQMRLNVGNAMNPTTGIFTAPRTGKYFFAYSGLSDGSTPVRIDFLFRNGRSSDWGKIGQAYGANNYVTFALESTLQLSKGDQICLYLKLGKIHEWIGPGFGPYSSFVGMLMEEDIFA